MSSATLRLVLLVSCCHAMVHVYELAFPSVEELIQKDYGVEKRVMGWMGNAWRLPFGFGAFFAGMLVDRYGAKWLLVIYLLGCAAMSGLAGLRPELPLLFATMFAMGSFASIYHPAGLALISHETSPVDRPRALGYHGIFGSLGIAAAPFLAGLALQVFPSWQSYFLLLVFPGVILALVIAFQLTEHHRQQPPEVKSEANGNHASRDETSNWRAFFILSISGMLTGFVYAALVNFWPRYLGDLSIRPLNIPDRSFRNYVAGGVLFVGIGGQYLAARLGKAGGLERQLAIVLLATVPLLVAMAYAEGNDRIWASSAVSFVIFMQQPLYNSLIAQYVPKHRRSVGYGFSNAMGFGVGSLGASFAGWLNSDRVIYTTLAGFALLSSLVVVVIARSKKE